MRLLLNSGVAHMVPARAQAGAATRSTTCRTLPLHTLTTTVSASSCYKRRVDVVEDKVLPTIVSASNCYRSRVGVQSQSTPRAIISAVL